MSLKNSVKSWFFGFLDGYISQDALYDLISRTLEDLRSTHLAAQCWLKEPRAREDLSAIRRLIVEYDLPYKGGLDGIGLDTCPPVDGAMAEKWANEMGGVELVSRNGLRGGTGYCMDLLLSQGDGPHREWIARELERLLRHTEIRKNRCLSPIVPAVGPAEEWVEKHRVAILLARHARRSRDIRFLNTALKLNDWAYPSHKGLRIHSSGPRLVAYIRSLVEQEASCKEIFAP